MHINIIPFQLTVVHLEGFKSHLTSRLGRHKTPIQAKQRVSQVRRVLQSPLCGGSLDGLLKTDLAATSWVEHAKGKEKGTVRKEGTLASYCHSVANFFDFLVVTKNRDAFTQRQGLSTLKIRQQEWRRIGASLQKEGRTRLVELQEEDYCKNILRFTSKEHQ